MRLDLRKSAQDDFVRTAAFLKREFEGRNETIEFLRSQPSGKRVLLVFDSDIIKTKCAPWITGPIGDSGDERNGYGAILYAGGDLPRDDLSGSQQAEAIAAILADYALEYQQELNPGMPIFQFPSHAVETNNVYRAVRRALEVYETVRPTGASLRRSFELRRSLTLMRHLVSSGHGWDEASSIVDDVVKALLNGASDATHDRVRREWDAYYGLEAHYGGIFALDTISAFAPNEPALVRAAAVLDPRRRNPLEAKLFDSLTEFWTRRLRSKTRTNTDAEALANLFLFNSRLLDTNWRCIFVTGDRNLARAAYHSIPDNIIPREFRYISKDFSLRYIRHLWSFSSDALIEPDRRQDFVDLFGGLLAHWSHRLGNFSAAALEGLVAEERPGEDISRSNMEKALDTWARLIRKSISRYFLHKFEDEAELRRVLLELVRASQDVATWSDLQDLFEEKVARLRDRMILRMSDLGLEVIAQAEELGQRNPPELVFESLKHTNQIFRRLGTRIGYRDGSFANDFKLIAKECHDPTFDDDDRQLNHLKFLVLGAAFASADKWLIALNHATRAIQIIERSRMPIPVLESGASGMRTHMSGREAFFLRAVAQRMLAQTLDEFDKAEEDLGRAVTALRKDHSVGTAFGISFGRFENERLANRLARYYFCRSRKPADLGHDLVGRIFETASSVSELFDNHLRGSAKSGLSLVTVVNIATNLIQTFVISEFRKGNGIRNVTRCPVELDQVAAAVAIIKELTTYRSEFHPERINATRLIRAYATVGAMFCATTEQDLLILGSELSREVRQQDRTASASYDDWRFGALLKYVEERFSLNHFQLRDQISPAAASWLSGAFRNDG